MKKSATIHDLYLMCADDPDKVLRVPYPFSARPEMVPVRAIAAGIHCWEYEGKWYLSTDEAKKNFLESKRLTKQYLKMKAFHDRLRAVRQKAEAKYGRV